MDFYRILIREVKDKNTGITRMELYPDFTVGRSKDLMVQGRTFYAIWDEAAGLWSRDEYDVQRLMDEEMEAEAARLARTTGIDYSIKSMRSFNSNAWTQFRKYIQNISDNSHPLDSKLVWANTEVKKGDYSSKRLPYALGSGDTEAWDELLGTLYSPEERAKIEWAIGSVVAGDSKTIQKFLVFYGPAGTGKSTILNIIESLFLGYTTTFDGKALGSNNGAFATEVFKHNPLVAIQHDGDLSRLEDNTRLNSIISHEEMTMNEKYKPSYTSKVDAMLFIGSNQPVKISDAKSGILRRLIDVHPTGVKLPAKHYHTLMSQIDLQLGAIAQKCLDVYRAMGKNYYGAYRPTEMMLQTDVFFNFIEAHYDVFKSQDQVTLKQAYTLYKEFCADSGIERPLPQYKMREELRNYFEHFHDRGEIDGEKVRSVYSGFSAEQFKAPVEEDMKTFSLVIDETESLLDDALAGQAAQLAKADGTPKKRWAEVRSTLSDIDTRKLHYTKVPKNHIVIDFDLKGEDGEKSLGRNLEAASHWPSTYAELSKSGAGVHLHYVYTGEVADLSPTFADGIEVKVFRGDSSLRRQLSRCNAVPVSEISSGLPLKEKSKVPVREKTISSERGLRQMIERNMQKEFHPSTKSSVDFIKLILDDTFATDLQYDVTDMRARVLAFANNSTNQAAQALKTVQEMKWKSESMDADIAATFGDDRIAFYDVEVYSNLFVICWKFRGSKETVRMINPKAHEVEALFKLKLVGFYNRRYDNHIIYAAAMGYTVEQLYELSQKMIVDNNKHATFGAAYNLSYADIWDFSSKKMSLKKFEIELGVHHMEMDIPWDEPVAEKDVERVVEYCVNDVVATEAVFEDRYGDFVARQILAELSGLTVNDTTQKHTAKIIFGDDKNPQQKFLYTDLAKDFPGYEFEGGKSSYKGEDPGEGGYVYAEPGVYNNVALLDVASMHPRSLVCLNAFGPYTARFEELIQARLAIKRGDYESARTMLDGRLAPYLEDESQAKDLSYALKIVINIVYGLTSAKFDNPFRDIKNKDNIVAKRGALFMIDLKTALQAKGVTVAHIKTDSVKIPDATPEIIEFVTNFGAQYGYEFEHEATYEKFCLVNDAVYVAKDGDVWSATGAQFQHPYVFKTLFTGDEITYDDQCESKSVSKGVMYLDMDHLQEKELDYKKMHHQGKTGRFVPVLSGGGVLYRVNEDKYHQVAGTKGHLWMDAEVAKSVKPEIDNSYHEKLVSEAVKTIEQFGRFDEFTN